MTEEVQNTSDMFTPLTDSPTFDFDDSTFFSPQIKPENIFNSEIKDTSEIQLASKILCFPFNLDCFNLIFLQDEKDPELIDPFCTVILGDIERVRFSDSVLKMVFYSKDRTTPLNLGDYLNEINSLKNFPGIEFICICLNKMFIQCEDDNTTKEAFNSLQKNYSSSDFLYDEEGSINSNEKQFKGINNLFSSEKKNSKDFNNIEEILSPNKNVKKLDFFNDNDINNLQEQNGSNTKNNNSFKESDFFKKGIWNSQDKSQKDDIKTEDKKIEAKTNQKTSQESFNKINPQMFPPQPFSPFIFPMYNLSKMKTQINPLLFMQYSKMNPFILQTALTLQQNIIKLQQMNLKGNEKNNGNINFNGKNNNINNETDKAFSPSNNKKSTTNSNTSSTTSSKESSPAINNHDKSYTNNNMNLPNINFGLFNGFNTTMNSIQNLNINNNKFQNNKEFNNDLLNLSKSDNNININNKSDSTQKQEDIKINPNFNLQQIVINNTFKEYVPKNNSINNNQNNNNKKIIQNMQNTPPSPPGKDVEFQTNSTRDYQYKYVSRYIVQIENEKNFPVTKMIIGNSGKLLRNILVKNCINNGDHTTKIRLRGKGSGYKEGPKNEESKDPMELCISSLNLMSYIKCSNEIENLLKNVYYQYYLYQSNNKKESDNDVPVVMKKILKYQYVVNRYNTLAKEEKRRKKEEELKQVNQVNKNTYSNNSDNI
jgi:hypothetical protein